MSPLVKLIRYAITALMPVCPERLTLCGRFIDIRPLNAAIDAEPLWSGLAGHDELWRYLAEGPFPDLAALRSFLERMQAQDDPLFYTLAAHGQPLGFWALMQIVPAHGVVEIGNIVFTPALQQSREATEAFYLMACYVFDTLQYRRFEWKCNAENQRSWRAAERYGFVFEGIFRQHRIVKGQNRDTAWFSMLDREWPQVKQALLRWLSDDNFDANGRQRQSLGAFRSTLAER